MASVEGDRQSAYDAVAPHLDVMTTVAGRLAPDDDRDEVVREAVRRVHAHHRLTGDAHATRIALLRATVAAAERAQRARERAEHLELVDAAPYLHSGGAYAPSRVEQRLATLSDEQRRIIALHVFADLPAADVAYVLHTTVDDVESTVWQLGAGTPEWRVYAQQWRTRRPPPPAITDDDLQRRRSAKPLLAAVVAVAVAAAVAVTVLPRGDDTAAPADDPTATPSPTTTREAVDRSVVVLDDEFLSATPQRIVERPLGVGPDSFGIQEPQGLVARHVGPYALATDGEVVAALDPANGVVWRFDLQGEPLPPYELPDGLLTTDMVYDPVRESFVLLVFEPSGRGLMTIGPDGAEWLQLDAGARPGDVFERLHVADGVLWGYGGDAWPLLSPDDVEPDPLVSGIPLPGRRHVGVVTEADGTPYLELFTRTDGGNVLSGRLFSGMLNRSATAAFTHVARVDDEAFWFAVNRVADPAGQYLVRFDLATLSAQALNVGVVDDQHRRPVAVTDGGQVFVLRALADRVVIDRYDWPGRTG